MIDILEGILCTGMPRLKGVPILVRDEGISGVEFLKRAEKFAI